MDDCVARDACFVPANNHNEEYSLIGLDLESVCNKVKTRNLKLVLLSSSLSCVAPNSDRWTW
jgi:hypothetical protein